MLQHYFIYFIPDQYYIIVLLKEMELFGKKKKKTESI